MKRRSAACWCAAALALSLLCVLAEGAASASSVTRPRSTRLASSSTQPSMSFSTLATFARRFWTAVATAASEDESRAKPDIGTSNTTTTVTNGTTPEPHEVVVSNEVTSLPSPATHKEQDLSTQIAHMLTEIANATSLRQTVRSGNRKGGAPTAVTEETSTEVPPTPASIFNDGSEASVDGTTTTSSTVAPPPTAFHVESTSIFAVTPSPSSHRAAPTEASTSTTTTTTTTSSSDSSVLARVPHPHSSFGCNDSSHVHVDERTSPPSTLHNALEKDIAQSDDKIIDSFLKTHLSAHEQAGSFSAAIPTATTTPAPPARRQQVVTRGPAPLSTSSSTISPFIATSFTTTPSTTSAATTLTHASSTTPSTPASTSSATNETTAATTELPVTSTLPAGQPEASPAAILSQLVNATTSSESMASIIKAITTAMVMVSNRLEEKLTTVQIGNASTSTNASLVTTSAPITSLPASKPGPETTPSAQPLTAGPPETAVLKQKRVPSGPGPLSRPIKPHRGPDSFDPVLRPFPSLFKVGLQTVDHDDHPHAPSDDHLDEDSRDEHPEDDLREVSNDVEEKEQKFEAAEVVKDEGPGEQTLTKRDDSSNTILRSPIKNATEEPGECFFDETDQSSMCGWNFTTQSSIRWSFGLGETAYMNGGPVRDSNGEPAGGYAFIDTSTGLIGASTEIQRATLESPSLGKTAPSGRCFTFWYNVGGLSSDRLRVLLVSEEDYAEPSFANRLPSFTVLWEHKDSTNHTWLKGEILYTFARQHRLIFEGFARSGNDPRRKFQGFMAVDDVVMDPESCLSFCTFEGLLCGWENDGDNDDFQWQLGRGSLSHLTGPVRDHGDGPEGGYMVIDSSYPRRPGDIARLVSPELPSTVSGPVCFKFWTHMYGNGIGTLKVLLKMAGDDSKTIWEVSGESGNSWHMAQVTVSSQGPYKIALEGMVGKNSLGSIAIDDLSFGPGPCPSSPQSALPSRGDCTFEADECGWINAGSGDQYDWLRTNAGQPLLPGQGPNTGYRPPEPLSDHTTGLSTGFFLTMERSTIPPRSGEQAYIVGPTLQGSEEGKCLSFWAYMHERSVDASGPGLGSLRIYLRLGSSSILRPIWRLINFEYPDWFFAQTHIKTTDKFQIVIGGTWGSTRQGAISVDDFTFYDGNCSVLPAEAQVTPGECTFDSNLCEWTSTVNATQDRTAWQLATSIRRPSNLDDHTYRAISGYVFFDIFSLHPHLVRLESPEIAVDNSSLSELSAEDEDARCLTFWYAAFGSSRNTFLRVMQRDVASKNDNMIWEVNTANIQVFRPEWSYGQVAIINNATHKIIFEGSSNNGGFAVDDIMFIPGFCQTRPETL